MHKALLHLLLFLLTSSVVLAQENYHFNHFRIEDGLSQGTIQALLQDAQGFIWVGTKDGLNRFDGYEFKVFQRQATDSTSISNNEITSLFQDTEGTLWVGTRNGLNLYSPKTQQFKRFFHSEKDNSSISDNIITSITSDSNQFIWVGTENGGLNYYNPSDQTFTKFTDTSYSVDPHIRCLYYDSKDRLWVGTQNNGAFSISIKQKHTISSFRHNPKDATSLSKNRVISIYEDTDQNIWLGTWEGGLNLLKKDTNTFQRIPVEPQLNGEGTSNNIITSIIQENDGNLWLSTWGGGINILDPKTLSVHYILPNENYTFGLNTNIVLNFLKDTEGNIWAGGVAKGLEVHRITTRKFKHYTHQENNPTSLNGNVVLGIIEDKQENLWVGTTDGGLNFLPKNGNSFTNYPPISNDATSISSKIILSLLEDSQGTIWVGTEASGLNKFNPETGIFKRYLHTKNDLTSISDNTIWDITEDRQGNIWIGTRSGGLNKYNPAENTFKHFNYFPNKKGSISSNTIKRIYEDSKGNLWVGTQGGGLNLFNPTTEEFTVFKNEINNSTSLSGNDIKSIYEDSKGNLWIGTNGNGLNLFHPDSQSFTSYHKSDGLTNEVVYGILEDESQNLWLSTNLGITIFSIDQKKVIQKYDKFDGLQNNEFNTGAYFKGKSGKLYFGGISGFNIISPSAINTNFTSSPKVAFTDLLFKNKVVDIRDDGVLNSAINSLNRLTIEYNYFPISFKFAAINESLPHSIQYQYQLIGLDKQWIDANHTQRVASYSKIPNGSYTFAVRASRDGKTWSGVKSMALIVLPPWWLTPIALFSWLVIIILLVVGVYTLRVSALKTQQRNLKKQVEERTAEISSQNKTLEEQKAEIETQTEELKIINEKLVDLDRFKQKMTNMIVHDLKNPLNLIINYEDENLDKTVYTLRNTGKSMLNLVLNILDIQKFEEAKISLNKDDISFTDLLNNSIQQIDYLAEKKDISIVLINEFDLYAYCDKDITERVIINLLSNALKFSQTGTSIEISIENLDKTIKCSIKDHGIGISQEEINNIFDKYYQVKQGKTTNTQSTGLGLTFSKIAIESQKGEIGVESKLGMGTTFWFTIPKSDTKTGSTSVINTIEARTASYLVNEPFSAQDKEILRTLYQQLKGVEVYSVTEINAILKSEILKSKSHYVQWKKQLETAVFNMDNEQYNLLLDKLVEENGKK